MCNSMAPTECVVKHPVISIIIPVRNAGDMLIDTFESILSQDYPHVEILVLDAASTDNTVDIIKRYEKHITFWRSHADSGTYEAYNEGISRASGDIIALLNADDWYEPGVLQKVAATFIKQPSLDIVTVGGRIVKGDNPDSMETLSTFSRKQLDLSPSAMPAPNLRFIRKALYERLGNFEMRQYFGKPYISSDLEFLLRLLEAKPNHKLLSMLGYNYRSHPQSATFWHNNKRERQMYVERMHMARRYIPHAHNPILKKRLKRWYRRGSVRETIAMLKEKRYKRAAMYWKRGSQYTPLWYIDFIRLYLKY